METKESNPTANAAALMRAAHLFVDDAPVVFEDQIALSFVGDGYEAVFREFADAFRTPTLTAVRAVIVMRNRYAEDELENAIARGITQYVILSAGLDSFVYRRRDLEKVLRVFEVDLPEIQEQKRQLLSKLGIDLPSNVTFIPLDLEKRNLAQALAASGYRSREFAFFSWMGATEYLTEDAVFGTLQDIASVAAPGSDVLLQYFLPKSMVAEEDRAIWEFSERTCRERGEPWISLFEPESLASILMGMGYYEIRDLGAKDAFDRYFRGRKDGFCPHNATRIMNAKVGTRAETPT